MGTMVKTAEQPSTVFAEVSASTPRGLAVQVRLGEWGAPGRTGQRRQSVMGDEAATAPDSPVGIVFPLVGTHRIHV